MPASQFDDVLHLMDPKREAPVGGLRAGPCGRGPIEAGATILSMQISVVQSKPGGGVAMAVGRSGEDAKTAPEEPPYRERWMIRTGLVEGSEPFDPGQPVLARAIALLEKSGGARELFEWTQDQVGLHSDHDHPH